MPHREVIVNFLTSSGLVACEHGVAVAVGASVVAEAGAWARAYLRAPAGVGWYRLQVWDAGVRCDWCGPSADSAAAAAGAKGFSGAFAGIITASAPVHRTT